MRKSAILGLLGTAVVAAVLVPGRLSALGAGREAQRADHRAPRAESRLDINRASVAELMKAPGMTRTWAGRIVRFRPYRAKSDLLERGVLPSAVYDRIKDYVVAHRVKKQD